MCLVAAGFVAAAVGVLALVHGVSGVLVGRWPLLPGIPACLALTARLLVPLLLPGELAKLLHEACDQGTVVESVRVQRLGTQRRIVGAQCFTQRPALAKALPRL